ncbi:hypothetical protein IF1G_10462 [Cordyceps javanica]|uniref:Uncharacterized protein n=1 Tax=Cordyceps javanica TaxID=43265 RepID=A0A545UNB6_9HYPO|nr:hypothetical protein IF1G_10462 [Cordyceps javanica]
MKRKLFSFASSTVLEANCDWRTSGIQDRLKKRLGDKQTPGTSTWKVSILCP